MSTFATYSFTYSTFLMDWLIKGTWWTIENYNVRYAPNSSNIFCYFLEISLLLFREERLQVITKAYEKKQSDIKILFEALHPVRQALK